MMSQAGITVKQYQSGNGRFTDNGFIESINQKYQKITFCGVGAHDQNGIVENRNHIMTIGARTFLLHGIIMWPQMIDKMFHPFAMTYISKKLNSFQIDHKDRTPESILH